MLNSRMRYTFTSLLCLLMLSGCTTTAQTEPPNPVEHCFRKIAGSSLVAQPACHWIQVKRTHRTTLPPPRSGYYYQQLLSGTLLWRHQPDTHNDYHRALSFWHATPPSQVKGNHTNPPQTNRLQIRDYCRYDHYRLGVLTTPTNVKHGSNGDGFLVQKPAVAIPLDTNMVNDDARSAYNHFNKMRAAASHYRIQTVDVIRCPAV